MAGVGRCWLGCISAASSVSAAVWVPPHSCDTAPVVAVPVFTSVCSSTGRQPGTVQVLNTQRCTCPQVWLYEGKRTLGFFMQRRSPLQVLARELGVAQELVVPTVMKQLLENLQVRGWGGKGGGGSACPVP